MNLDQLAKAHDIIDAKALHDVLIRTRDTYFDAWFEEHYVGHDSLDEAAQHLHKAIELMQENENYYALEKAGANLGKVFKAAFGLRNLLMDTYEPRKRGRTKRKAARAFANVLVEYWTEDLGRNFTQYWTKDYAGNLDAVSEGAQFVLDVAKMVGLDPDEIILLQKASAEAVATLRKKG